MNTGRSDGWHTRRSVRCLFALVGLWSGAVFLFSCSTTSETYFPTSRGHSVTYKERIAVVSEPSGARVYWNDELMGPAPLEFDASATIELKQEGTITKVWNDWAIPPKEVSRSTDWYGPTLDYVVEGTGVLRAVLEGYESAEHTIELGLSDPIFKRAYLDNVIGSDAVPTTIGARRPVLMVLKPTPASREARGQQQQQQQQTVVVPGEKGGTAFGTVSVVCNLDHAEIMVDGAYVGNSPANLKLSVGIHIVVVKAPGYEEYKREVRVTEGSELVLRATLEN